MAGRRAELGNAIDRQLRALAEAAAAGAWVIVKEAVANGRLAPGGADSPGAHRVAELASEAGTTADA